MTQLSIETGVERIILDVGQHIATDKEIREASVAADKVLSDFDVELR